MFDVRTQIQICERFGALFVPAGPGLKLGVAENVRSGIWPLNGLRHQPNNGTSGWYIWAGVEFSDREDFFQSLHVEHIKEWCPMAAPYLGLGPGWRFLVTNDREDVWFDPTLLSGN